MGANFFKKFPKQPLVKLFKRLAMQNQQHKFDALWALLDEHSRKHVDERNQGPESEPAGLRRRTLRNIECFSAMRPPVVATLSRTFQPSVHRNTHPRGRRRPSVGAGIDASSSSPNTRSAWACITGVARTTPVTIRPTLGHEDLSAAGKDELQCVPVLFLFQSTH